MLFHGLFYKNFGCYMRNIIKKILVFGMLIVLFSCYKEYGSSDSLLIEKEEIFQSELEEELPDFSSPTFVDPLCAVADMPEEVQWLTSKPADLGSPETKVGGVFRMTLPEYPQTFRFMGPGNTLIAKNLIWTSANLVATNPETQEPMPYAATHWAFGADGRTVYFKLNEQAKWSDGVPCTADDFLFSWEFMQSPYLEDPWFSTYATHFEVHKINKYCISIKNIQPTIFPPLTLLDAVNISPRPKHFFDGKITEDWYTKYDWHAEPTTGAYYLNEAECVPGKRLVFNRVPNWWARSNDYLKKTANIERIEYSVLEADESIEKLFYKGKIDILNIKSKAAWESCVLQRPVKNGYVTKYVFNRIPLTGIKGICLNTGSKIFSSRNIRFGLYYALDIQGMIDGPLRGEYIRYHNVGNGQVWGGVNFNDHSIKIPDYDPDTARTFFAKEGYVYMGGDGILRNASGDRLSFELLYSEQRATEQLIYLKQKARAAGLEIRLVCKGNYIQELSTRNFEAASQEFWGWYFPEYNDYFSLESYNNVDSYNIWNYTSPEMEELLNIALHEKSLEGAAENNKKIERLIHDEALVIPTYISDFMRLLAWRWIRFPSWGNKRSITNDFDPYGYMWIDESIKVELQKLMNRGEVLEPNEYHLSERYLHDTY